MAEKSGTSSRCSWFNKVCNKLVLRVRLWFLQAELPDPESSDYAEVAQMDVSTTELMIINTKQQNVLGYIKPTYSVGMSSV